MLLGDLSRTDFAKSLPPVFARLCTKLSQLNLEALELGWQNLEEGIRMNVMAFDTAARETKQAEMHRKFIDIQLLISGIEAIDYGIAQPDFTQFDEYRDDDDYQLTPEIKQGNTVVLYPKQFAIFLPYEPHTPGISVNNEHKSLKKLVVKVPIELLEA